MRLHKQLTDEAILRELGRRLAATRLAANLTQAELAHEAGVAKRTIERLESGEVASRLTALVRICRVSDGSPSGEASLRHDWKAGEDLVDLKVQPLLQTNPTPSRPAPARAGMSVRWRVAPWN